MTKKRKRSDIARDAAITSPQAKKHKAAGSLSTAQSLHIDKARVARSGSQTSHHDHAKHNAITNASAQQLSRSALKRRRKKRKSGQNSSQFGAPAWDDANQSFHERSNKASAIGSGGRSSSFAKSAPSRFDVSDPSRDSCPRSPLLGRVLSFDEPPPGLNSKARKRWRQRHRRRSGSSATTGLTVDNMFRTHGKENPDSTVPEQRHVLVALPGQSQADKLAQQVTRTSLVQRPRKEWIQDHKHLPASVPLAILPGAAETDTSSVSSDDEDSSAESQSSSIGNSTIANATSLERPTKNTNPPPYRQSPALAIAPDHPVTKPMSGLSRFKQALSSGPASSIGEAPRIGLSNSHKATSVPLYDTTSDPTTAFKRFSAFMSGKNESSSESSTEESDSDDSSGDDSVAMNVTSTKADLHYQPLTGEGPSLLQRDKAGSKDGSVATSSNNVSHDTSALTRDAGTNAQPSSYQANEKRKRFTSTVEPGIEDRREGPGPEITLYEMQRPATSSQHRPGLHTQESSHLEDISENILSQTIDEISHGVFDGTLALPFSKAHPASFGHSPEEREAVLTKAPSDCKPGLIASYVIPSDKLGRFGSSRAIVCNSVRVLGPDPAMHLLDPVPEVIHSVQVDDNSAREAEQSSSTIIDTTLSRSSSPLSELGRTPSPPLDLGADAKLGIDGAVAASSTIQPSLVPTLKKKRSMTGLTSKHFSPVRTPRTKQAPGVGDDNLAKTGPARRTRSATKSANSIDQGRKAITSGSDEQDDGSQSTEEDIDASEGLVTPAKKRKVVAGVSNAPVPPISAERFGILQEKLWREPFKLIIAVTFLNKTAGRSAAPVFWQLMEQYPTVEALANADKDDLFSKIWQLGLGNQRSKRLIEIAKAWSAQPPEKGLRYRTLHYPNKQDGKQFKKSEVIEEDADVCDGALEIGHIPGCGRYAWDSWRICCRDVLRGVADDYNGKNASQPDFEPEWKRVVPEDKELRACLRWMWLREGWIWDCHDGKKRPATEVEMAKARRGEMEVSDSQELKFAAQAAGVDLKHPAVHAADDSAEHKPVCPPNQTISSTSPKPQPSATRTATPGARAAGGDSSDNIVVSPRLQQGKRKTRSKR